MKKKIALMILLTLMINLVFTSVSFAGVYNFPWSIQLEETQTTVTE